MSRVLSLIDSLSQTQWLSVISTPAATLEYNHGIEEAIYGKVWRRRSFGHRNQRGNRRLVNTVRYYRMAVKCRRMGHNYWRHYRRSGRTGENVLTAENLALTWDFTDSFEKIPQVDEVLSLSTMNRIDSDDGFMEVSELMESNNPSKEEIIEIKSYLNSNTTLSSRINSKDGEYTSIIIKPKDGVNNAILVEKIIPLTNVI